MQKKLYLDIGSTYFKVGYDNKTRQYFRDFNKDIYSDLKDKCGSLLKNYSKEQIYICSSANGGLSTLIIGLTSLFSIKYATNIAFNSGINIIDKVLYSKIEEITPPDSLIDVVIIVGGIDIVKPKFDIRLIKFLKELKYNNIVYVGNRVDVKFLEENIPNLVVLPNIITNKLKVREEFLRDYLTNLYQKDIVGKEDIKRLYEITSNQIYPTPYIVNRSLPRLREIFEVADPFLVIDIGGATTDIHYSTDLVAHKNIITESGYDRLVFKKLGVYKSRDSLIFSAKNNEFVYELLDYLGLNDTIFQEHSSKATITLMQLAIFLVLYFVSKSDDDYEVILKLEILKSIVITGGVSKVLSIEDIKRAVRFFYKKILHFDTIPEIIVDREYKIWTLGMNT